MSKRLAGFTLIVPLALLTALSGCLSPPPPPPEAVLAGDWSLTAPETDLSNLMLRFDENGALTLVVYKIGDSATLFQTSPVATSDVNGDAVAIVATFDGNSLSFVGTLDGNTIDGRITTTITSGSLILVIDDGPATMTRL